MNEEISTPLQVLLNVVLWLILFLILRKQFFSEHPEYKKTTIWFSFLLILVFCLFPYWGGDYWHYMQGFQFLRSGRDTNMEEVYSSIAGFVPTYFLFRLLLWGTAFVLLIATFYRLKLNIGLSLFVFVCFFLPLFSYARVSVAMSMMFFGLSLLITYNRKPIIFILGLGLIVASYYFHKSAVFGISMILVSLLMLISNRVSVVSIILFLPLILSFAKTQLFEFMALSGDDNIAVGVGQNYLNADSNVMGISHIIRLYSQRFSLLLVSFLVLRVVLNTHITIPPKVRVFGNAAALCGISSLLLLLIDSPYNVTTVSLRFSYFAWIPAIAFLSYCKENHLYKKWVNVIMFIATISTAYDLLYSLYCSINNFRIL